MTRQQTIVDVAQRADVSIATVSRVLNDRPVANVDMVRRVRVAAAELGYRPSGTARSLQSGKTKVVGVVVPDLANPSFSELLRGLADGAAAHGHRVLVAGAKESPEEERNLVAELSLHADGLVLCSPRMPSSEIVELANRPVVCTNRAVDGYPLGSAVVDSAGGMATAVRHLAGHGHQHIGYLGGPPTSWSEQEQHRGLEEAAAEMGMQVAIETAGSAMADGFRALPKLLDCGVTSVLAFNDLVAIGCFARLRERSLTAPHDVSIVGFDDIPVAAFLDPALTTIRVPTEDLGRQAWELLWGQLERDEEPRSVSLPTELVLRASTGPPAGA